MTATVNGDVFQLLEKWAPTHLAYEWDRVGLQVGSRHNKTSNILVTLDVNHAVIDEAIEKNVNLIIAHHPIMFRPFDQIDTESIKGLLLQKLLKHDITVYAAHTNLDIASGGVNDLLCQTLGLNNLEMLEVTGTEKLIKVIVYVPQSHADDVRQTLGRAGGGFIGDYSHCTFNTNGQGTFKPAKGTDPYIGTIDELSTVEETKIETIVQESLLSDLIDNMLKVHPYEEVAYDLYELANQGKINGIGRIGYLRKEMKLGDLAVFVKEKLNVSGLRIVGDFSKTVRKVAVLGGSGEKFISAAMNQKADVLITGDLTFHPAQDALEAGMCLIDPGHHIERVMKQAVKLYLEEHLNGNKNQVYASSKSTEPFQFI